MAIFLKFRQFAKFYWSAINLGIWYIDFFIIPLIVFMMLMLSEVFNIGEFPELHMSCGTST